MKSVVDYSRKTKNARNWTPEEDAVIIYEFETNNPNSSTKAAQEASMYLPGRGHTAIRDRWFGVLSIRNAAVKLENDTSATAASSSSSSSSKSAIATATAPKVSSSSIHSSNPNITTISSSSASATSSSSSSVQMRKSFTSSSAPSSSMSQSSRDTEEEKKDNNNDDGDFCLFIDKEARAKEIVVSSRGRKRKAPVNYAANAPKCQLWTFEEDQIIIREVKAQGMQRYGDIVARLLPGRSAPEIEHRWKSTLSKLIVQAELEEGRKPRPKAKKQH